MNENACFVVQDSWQKEYDEWLDCSLVDFENFHSPYHIYYSFGWGVVIERADHYVTKEYDDGGQDVFPKFLF